MWEAIINWLKQAGQSYMKDSGLGKMGGAMSDMSQNGMTTNNVGAMGQGINTLNSMNQAQLSKNQVQSYGQPQMDNPYANIYMQYRR